MKIGPFEFMTVRETDNLRGDLALLRRQMEDMSWMRLGTTGSDAKTLLGVNIHDVIIKCRKAWHSSPLIGHGVRLSTAFVFGQGISEPKANDERIQTIVSEFWKDRDNWASLTSPDSQQKNSNKLQYDGQVFFGIFVNRTTGRVKVRVLDPLTIGDIVNIDDDSMRPIFYKQAVSRSSFNFATGTYEPRSLFNQFRYIPDCDLGDPNIYQIPAAQQAWTKNDYMCLLHVKVNCDPLDKWGMPEIYRAIDWTNAHRDMASDLATLIRSLATWVWKKKVKGTQSQINAFKNALQMVQQQNVPKATAGSMQIENDNVDLDPINTPTGAAQIHEIGLRQMRLQVAAGFSIFEHYFGDAGNANLASTKAMELPMLKIFLVRQQLWEGVFDKILQFVVDQAIVAQVIPGTAEMNETENRLMIETPVDRMIDIDFPPILDQDIKELADAMTVAADGGMISRDTAARQFMIGMNINNVEEEIEKLEKEKDEREAKAKIRMEGEEEPEPGQPENELDKFLKTALKKAKNGNGNGAKEADVSRGTLDGLATLQRKIRAMRRGIGSYEKALAGAFRRFIESLPKKIKTVGPEGVKRAVMPDLDAAVDVLVEDMQKAARAFFPEAIRVGTSYVYSHLKKGIEQVSMKEASHRSYLDDRLQWNARFLLNSLSLDMKRAMEKALLGEFPDDEEARVTVVEAMKIFEPRIRQYSGAYWTVEERAVKEFGKEFDLMVNFIGPEDEANCPDCAEAVSGGPFRIESAPTPGEDTVCRGNCRHALQIIGQEPIGIA